MMDLKSQGYEAVAEKTVENLVIKKGRIDLATITADGEMKRGTLLFDGGNGKLTATATAGKARAILAENVTGTGDVNAEVFYGGIFYANGIIGTITAEDVDALRARDIYIETPAV